MVQAAAAEAVTQHLRPLETGLRSNRVGEVRASQSSPRNHETRNHPKRKGRVLSDRGGIT